MAEQQPRSPSYLDLAFLSNDSDATEVVLVRHGEQRLPAPGSPTSEFVDPPLSSRGQLQARLVGERFRGARVDIVYSSPLTRAYDTGAEIARHHHRVKHEIDGQLREVELFRDVPRGAVVAEYVGRRAMLGLSQRMLRERRWDVYPHSESSAEFRSRVVTVIEGIAAEHPGRRVFIACHGGVINAYLGWILEIPQDMWFRPAHTAVHIVRAKGHVRAVETIGDTNHLQTADGDLRSW